MAAYSQSCHVVLGRKKSGVIMFFGLHGAVGRIGESDQTRHGYGVGAADFARGKVELKS